MKHRRAAKIDANQNEIVAELRRLDGITVEVGHDDILVGYGGRTFWFEVKTGPRAEIKSSQTKLLDSWQGHYAIVWSAQMILNAIEYRKQDGAFHCLNRQYGMMHPPAGKECRVCGFGDCNYPLGAAKTN